MLQSLLLAFAIIVLTATILPNLPAIIDALKGE